MKLTAILEETSQNDKFEDYIVCNLLIGQALTKRQRFEKYLKSDAAKVELPGQNYLDNVIEQSERKWFYDENGREITEYEFSGNVLKPDVMTSFVIYGYDFFGKPPFEFSKTDEYHSFGIYQNCESLTELPDWIPPRMYQFQLSNSNIRSLKDINKKITHCFEMWFGPEDGIKNLSYLAGIQGLERVTLSNRNELTKIVEDYLANTPDEKRDIIDLHSVLIDAGFEDYA